MDYGLKTMDDELWTKIGFTQIAAIAFPLIAVLFLWWMRGVEADNLTYNVDAIDAYANLETNYLYLIINGLSVLFPFLLSFDRRVRFYKKWKYLLPAIGLTALVFVPWDIYFTVLGVWGFNPNYYYEPLKFLSLPMGEWLFFFVMPYCCVFIYECLNYYFPKDYLKNIEPFITYLLILTLLTVSIIHWEKMYTATTFLLTAAFLMYFVFTNKRSQLSRYYLAYLVSLIPFFIVNGILTGAFTKTPIVVYNNAENLGIRLGTIPLDDLVYCLLLLLMNMSLFEYFRKKELKITQTNHL